MMIKRQMHWVNLIDSCELERGDVMAVEMNGLTYAIYDTIDGVFVSDARCTHAGANLCDGYFDGKYIECPLHQGLFDARTGAAKSAPAVRALKMFESRVHRGKVQVRQQAKP